VSQLRPSSVSIGIHVPSSAVAPLDSDEAYAEFFRQVEALGLDAVWTEDRIFHDANMLDPLMLLASAAACTRRIELFCLDNATVRPAARVPLYVGGHAEGALRRAGELADGWIMSPFGTVRDFPGLWRKVQDSARAAGRNPDSLVAGRLVYVAVDEDRERAQTAMRTFLHGYYGARFDVDQWAIVGTAREVAARPAEHVEAGITKLMPGIPSLDLAHLRRVANEVAPVVRARTGAAR